MSELSEDEKEVLELYNSSPRSLTHGELDLYWRLL